MNIKKLLVLIGVFYLTFSASRVGGYPYEAFAEIKKDCSRDQMGKGPHQILLHEHNDARCLGNREVRV